MQLTRKLRNLSRALLQRYGTKTIKTYLWNSEFSRGCWGCLDSTPGDCIYSVLEKYAGKGSILDLGCGSGSTGNELTPTYAHYTGVDISDVALKTARKRSADNRRGEKNRYVHSDIVDYVPTQSFDVILFRDSIYYVERGRIKSMLDRYARYLNPDGVFIVRLAGVLEQSRRLLDIIERSFEVVERQLFDEPAAVVVVFRSR
jgi:SAM-dependent methyltransferase